MFTEWEKRLIVMFFFIVFVCACCSLLAYPQEYRITEQQLLELEANCQNLKTNNILLASQVQKLNTKCEALEISLNKERTISRNMSKSCAELDSKLSKEHQAQAETLQELNKQKLKNEKQSKWLAISIAISAGLLAICVMLLLFLIKK